MNDRPNDPAIAALRDGNAEVVESNFEGGRFEVRPSEKAQEAAPEEELIAGKFKTQDDLLKAYKELEGKLGAQPEEAPTEKPEEPAESEEPAEGEEPSEEEVEEAVEQAGLDMSALTAEWEKDGSLSDESYEALGKAGISRAMVDGYTAASEAILTRRGQTRHQAAGGEDNFDALVKWGTANLSEDEQATFNAAVDSAVQTGDFAAATMLISGLKAQMGGSEPNLLNSETSDPSPSVAPFTSQAEVTTAMRDPRYRTDPAYIAEVTERLRVTAV